MSGPQRGVYPRRAMPTEKLRAAWADVVAVADSPERRRLMAEIHSKHPGFAAAVNVEWRRPVEAVPGNG